MLQILSAREASRAHLRDLRAAFAVAVLGWQWAGHSLLLVPPNTVTNPFEGEPPVLGDSDSTADDLLYQATPPPHRPYFLRGVTDVEQWRNAGLVFIEMEKRGWLMSLQRQQGAPAWPRKGVTDPYYVVQFHGSPATEVDMAHITVPGVERAALEGAFSALRLERDFPSE